MREFLKRLPLAVFLLVFSAAGCGNHGGTVPSEDQGTLEPRHRFILKDTGGKTVSLDELLQTRPAVLLNFWATWCPPCREEIPDLIRLQAKYGEAGLTVIGVDVGESSAKVSAFAAKTGINYPIVLDADMKVSENYGVVGIPTSFLIDADGNVVGVYHAFTPQLVSDVERILGQKE